MRTELCHQTFSPAHRIPPHLRGQIQILSRKAQVHNLGGELLKQNHLCSKETNTETPGNTIAPTVAWNRAKNYDSEETAGYVCTVEPPNKGHFGGNNFVPCREVVPISEVK